MTLIRHYSTSSQLYGQGRPTATRSRSSVSRLTPVTNGGGSTVHHPLLSLHGGSTGAASPTAAVAPSPVRWNAIPHWCTLCVEPINGWNEHLGKREHISLELVYKALVHYDRCWDPLALWAELDAWLRPSAAFARMDRDAVQRQLGVPRHLFMDGTDSPVNAFNMAFEHADPLQRRLELRGCLAYLRQHGLLPLEDRQAWTQCSMEGALVLFKEVFPPLAHLFPRAEAKDISALSQLVASPFNLETVYDLCGLQAVAPAWSLPDGGSHPPVSEAAEACRATPLDSGSASSSSGEDSEAADARHKAVCCRAVLGALRWALEPEALPPPASLRSADAYRAAGFQAVVAAQAARLLVSEIVLCKVGEYVSRVEGVFRQADVGLAEAALYRHANNPYYDPRVEQRVAAAAVGTVGRARHSAVTRAAGGAYFLGRSSVVPPHVNWGMVQYMENGKFLHARPPSTAAAAAAAAAATVTEANVRPTAGQQWPRQWGAE